MIAGPTFLMICVLSVAMTYISITHVFRPMIFEYRLQHQRIPLYVQIILFIVILFYVFGSIVIGTFVGYSIEALYLHLF